MNELLKTKYYGLIKNKNFIQYEKIGKVLATLENKLIDSQNQISKEQLIEFLLPIKTLEQDVYNEIIKDLNNGLIYGGINNDGVQGII